MTATEKMKRSFRSSKAWRDLIHLKQVEQNGIDPITKRKLRKYATCHHLNLNARCYEDISDPSHFILVNTKTHSSLIHDLYKYWVKDPEIITRLVNLFERMKEITESSENLPTNYSIGD